MTLGQYLHECRTRVGRSLPKAAAELFATGKFGQYKNGLSFEKSIQNLEKDRGEKDPTKRNLKMFDGRLGLWAKAYGAREDMIQMLLGQKSQPEEKVTGEPEVRICRKHNLFVVFSILKEYSDVSEREFERIVNFVERLDVVPTEEIIRAYVSQILRK